MKLIVRYQKIGSNNILRGETSLNQTEVHQLLGAKGYLPIHCIEKPSKTDNNTDPILIVPLGRR